MTSHIDVTPLWTKDDGNHGNNISDTACQLHYKINSTKGVIFHGSQDRICSLLVDAASDNTHLLINVPSYNSDNDGPYFFLFMERLGDLDGCSNRYVVLNHQMEACSVKIWHRNVLLVFQGNVSVNIFGMAGYQTQQICPEPLIEQIFDDDDDDSQEQNGLTSSPRCHNVKGYNDTITCYPLDDEGGVCVVEFKSRCNATLGNREVLIHCPDDIIVSSKLIIYPVYITSLYFSSNNIVVIQMDSFLGLGSVLFLYLFENEMVTLAPSLFHNLVNLMTLDLSSNRLVTLPNVLFYGLDHLRELYLTGNKLVSLDVTIFNGLTLLGRLHLQDTEQRHLPGELLAGLSNLYYLRLSSNQLVSLKNNTFQDVNRLIYLSLSNNKLRSLSIGLFAGLRNLKYLYLHNNQLHHSMFRDMRLLVRLFLQGNLMRDLEHGLFYELSNLNELTLYDNPLVVIDGRMFEDLERLTVLVLRTTNLTNLPADLFHETRNLDLLYLYDNLFTSLEPGVFRNLRALTLLSLYNNTLSSLSIGLFDGLYNLLALDLSGNRLVGLTVRIFQDLRSLQILLLKYNIITALQDYWFYGLEHLRRLVLYQNDLVTVTSQAFYGLNSIEFIALNANRLIDLPGDAFNRLTTLQSMFLSNNNLETLPRKIFHDLKNLTILQLQGNRLKGLDFDIFKETEKLDFLDLAKNKLTTIPNIKHLTHLSFLNIRNNHLEDLHGDTFVSISTSAEVYVSQHEICECFASAETCSASDNRSPYLTCERLLSDRTLAGMMWLVGLNALGGNVFVLVWRGRYRSSQKNKVQDFFLRNLALSDLLMGLYMMIIAFADVYFGVDFPMRSETWRASVTCKIAGAISIISSEASVFFVTLISIDRFINIRFPYSTRKFGRFSTRIAVVSTWIFAIILGIVPSGLSGRNFRFYDNSHVCIGLPLALVEIWSTQEFTENVDIGLDTFYEKDVFTTEFKGLANGMYFSTVVFLGLNSLCYLVVIVCYVEIVFAVRRSSKLSGRTQDMQEQIRLTTKVTAVVVTDLLCWSPIICLGILVQTRVITLPTSVYAWSVTFILPINSAINPYLYTIAEVVSIYRKNNDKPPANNAAVAPSATVKQLGSGSGTATTAF